MRTGINKLMIRWAILFSAELVFQEEEKENDAGRLFFFRKDAENFVYLLQVLFLKE